MAGEALTELLDVLVEVGVAALQGFEQAVDVEGGAHGAVVEEEVEVTEAIAELAQLVALFEDAIADGVVGEEAADVEATGQPGGVGLQNRRGVVDEALAFAALLGESLALFGGEAGEWIDEGLQLHQNVAEVIKLFDGERGGCNHFGLLQWCLDSALAGC